VDREAYYDTGLRHAQVTQCHPRMCGRENTVDSGMGLRASRIIATFAPVCPVRDRALRSDVNPRTIAWTGKISKH